MFRPSRPTLACSFSTQRLNLMFHSRNFSRFPRRRRRDTEPNSPFFRLLLLRHTELFALLDDTLRTIHPCFSFAVQGAGSEDGNGDGDVTADPALEEQRQALQDELEAYRASFFSGAEK